MPSEQPDSPKSVTVEVDAHRHAMIIAAELRELEERLESIRQKLKEALEKAEDTPEP